ncbi:MAG TPA: type IIL restriction-modification enzyme MmeI [Terriglobales bacterium]|nr:type IIL restriction-modification enzyme MmeI [Terriglobales bacterium]
MRLSWNEIRVRAAQFAEDWRGAGYERGESQTFYNEFFAIFGIKRRRVATFEEPVRLLGAKRGYVDLLWKGVLLLINSLAYAPDPPVTDGDTFKPSPPLIVTSIYRTPQYSVSVGGSSHDGHVHGMAIDYLTNDSQDQWNGLADYLAYVNYKDGINICTDPSKSRLARAAQTA